ncbi:MAG: hypothetical protein IBX50_07705 [Marinospirillum sp.]|uniref:hypothetical protein n=1 Tax=Marinospirillum sp. TaxID=2183934 RepID=UPI001A0B2391|nr:hypothetical protein [Marinospirillum sp.]MBE0506592.1 hypothetical protein [Marinospirillum sp.]
MLSTQIMQKLIRLTGTPRQDIPSMSVLILAYPYGFGVLSDHADLLGSYPQLLEQRGLITLTLSRGRMYFYSTKLMDFYINEVYPHLNQEKSVQAREEINRLITGYAALGMEPAAVQKVYQHYAKKLPTGTCVMTAEGIKQMPTFDREVTRLKDLEFVSRSGETVLIGDSFIDKLQKEFSTLSVQSQIAKAIQINNALPGHRRKTVAGLNMYLRNFLSRSSPVDTSASSIGAGDIETVKQVFYAWRAVTNNPAQHPDAGQIQKILAPLKNGYTASQLTLAIQKASQDPWFAGHESRMTLGFLMSADRLQQLLSARSILQGAGVGQGAEYLDGMDSDIADVFKEWAAISDSPATHPDQGQRQMIIQALQMGYSKDQIRQSFQSAAVNEWHTGTGRYAGQGSKMTLNILLKADILQRNLQDATCSAMSITQDMATQGLLQVALGLKHH